MEPPSHQSTKLEQPLGNSEQTLDTKDTYKDKILNFVENAKGTTNETNNFYPLQNLSEYLKKTHKQIVTVPKGSRVVPLVFKPMLRPVQVPLVTQGKDTGKIILNVNTKPLLVLKIPSNPTPRLDANNYCRLCAQKFESMLPLLGSSDIQKEMLSKIKNCLPISVQAMDTFPKQACFTCLRKLNFCYDFQETVLRAQNDFVKMGFLNTNTTVRNVYFQQIRTESNSVSETSSSESTSVKFMSPSEESKAEENLPAMENPSLILDEHLPTESSLSVEISTSEDPPPSPLNNSTDNKNSWIKEKQSPDTDKTDDPSMDTSQFEDVTFSEMEEEGTEIAREEETPIVFAPPPLDHTYSGTCAKSHTQETRNSSKSKTEKESKCLKCRICQEKFQTAKEAREHAPIHAEPNYHPCCLCTRFYDTREKCDTHGLIHTDGKKCQRRAAVHACDKCDKKFVTKERLDFHLTFHRPDARPCYCEKCDKYIVSESSLYHHVLMVHQQFKEFCCDICGKQFRAQVQLDAHQRKHKNERPFVCSFCDKSFYSNETLKRHKKLHLPEKPYSCNQCGRKFDRTNALTKHLLKHQVEAGRVSECLSCVRCGEVFLDPQQVDSHVGRCELPDESAPEELRFERQELRMVYRCEFCDKYFSQEKRVKEHGRTHQDGPTPYVCLICNISFATFNQVTAHKVAHRKSNSQEATIPRYFCCQYCSKTFLHFTNMNIHRRNCSRRKANTCRYCRKVFDTPNDLANHQSGIDSQSLEICYCYECNLAFGSVCAREKHRYLQHRGETKGSEKKECEKTSVCPHCGKAFGQKTHLAVHIRSHTGERPYSCDQCEKTFKIKMERDYHRRVHTGERPFQCKVCAKTFTRPARLREHALFHTNVRPYECSICGRAFKKADARNVHMTIHTGSKPYRCSICQTSFRRTGDMRKHAKTVHDCELILSSPVVSSPGNGGTE